MALSAQRQFRVSIKGITGVFMTKSGGEVSSDSNKIFPGGTKTPEVLTSPAQTANIVVSRPYDPDRDDSILATLRPLVGIQKHDISVQATDKDLAVIGSPIVYSNSTLVRIGEPQYDANNGEAAIFELEYSVISAA